MQRATDDMIFALIFHCEGTRNTARLRLRGEQRAHIVQQLVQIERHFLKLHFAGFQLAHIEHIVYKL